MSGAGAWRGGAARWVVAYTVAVVGDVSYFLILTWAAAEAGGPRTSGLVLALGAVPRAVLMLLGGVLADRVDPRRIAVGTDAARALLLLLAAGAASWYGLVPWWLAVLAVAFGVVDACFIPAVGAMPVRLVPIEALPRLQAWRLTGLRVGNAVGPSLGALLVALGISAALASVAVLFAISVVLLLTVRSRPGEGPAPAAAAPAPPLRLSRLRQEGLVPLVVGTALSELPFSGPVAIGVVLLAQERGWPVASAGGVLAAFSVGGLVVSVLLATIPTQPLGRRATLAALWPTAPLLVLLGTTPVVGVAIAASGLLGAMTGTVMVLCHGRIQQSTPPALLGRVTALLSMATLGLSPLGYGAVGMIAGAWGVGVFFVLSAAVVTLAGLVLLRDRSCPPVAAPSTGGAVDHHDPRPAGADMCGE
ncbi:MFS transporter [Krasilnikoviella flava]|uniref:Predicted arabinose efflux permease, MFS family n=1 Tax=Krasilnikoviella flava TaxID=526729 RepID=A0A1T5JJ23_9MICO|nr:MFS transporter [Krasilnikoviella flava]SKC51218.1 Predicted arabinose efflux permease, MFS family [Krasilnikoviella flava]